MTEQQLARKGAKALLRKLSIDVGTLGIEPGPAACEAGVILLHHVILMLLPEAGVEAFTDREGQQLKADSARALRARGASTAEQQLADGMLHRLSNDAGGPNGKIFRGPKSFFSAESTRVL